MTEYCLYLWFILFVENDGKLVLLKTKHTSALMWDVPCSVNTMGGCTV